MVGGFNGDDIRAEVRSQEETERLDGVGSFWLPSGETQLRELLVRLQHDHVGTEHNPSLFLLVVVYLDGSIVRHSEGDHLGLVALGSCGGTGAGCKRGGLNIEKHLSISLFLEDRGIHSSATSFL